MRQNQQGKSAKPAMANQQWQTLNENQSLVFHAACMYYLVSQ